MLIAKRFLPFGTTIFSEMTAMAKAHNAINLAQGFPDFDGPESLKEAAQRALEGPHNQYARSLGHPELVQGIAQKFNHHYGRPVNGEKEVGVYCGATEGIAATILGLVNPGDEVVLFEPYYDSYLACIAMAGGVPRFCTLRAPDFSFDIKLLRSLLERRPKLLILNSPHNPTGKVFSRGELNTIAELCIENDVCVLSDEVYEHIVFDNKEHIPIATLPGMWERTLSLSSTGKTFSMTGWKIGYGVGGEKMIAAAQCAHQFLTFSTATPLQVAMVEAMKSPLAFYQGLRADYELRRDFLAGALRDVGFKVLPCRGTYFLLVDVVRAGFENDIEFSKYLTCEVGVACIPTSVFYSTDTPERGRLARFAFCKSEGTLQAAAERLRTVYVGRNG